jgi:pimeloyl-ACP methyl ester carboxylesterase
MRVLCAAAQGAAAMYNSYRANDYLPVLAQPPAGCEVHLVRGELSDRWSPGMVQELQQCQQQASEQHSNSYGSSGTFTVHVLPKAGHWLHTDNPDGLHALLHEHMLRVVV